MLTTQQKQLIKATFPNCEIEQLGNRTFDVHVKSKKLEEQKAMSLPFQYLEFDYSDKESFFIQYRFINKQ